MEPDQEEHALIERENVVPNPSGSDVLASIQRFVYVLFLSHQKASKSWNSLILVKM